MAIKMEWTIPKDGVMFAAKFSSSGIRRFSAVGLGFSLVPKTPATPPAVGRRHSATSGNTARNATTSASNAVRKARVRSAPTMPSQQSGEEIGRDRAPPGEAAAANKGTSAKPALSRPAADGGDPRRVQSAGWGSMRKQAFEDCDGNAAAASSSPSSPPRMQSAWGRLARDLVPGPAAEVSPKIVWGEILKRLEANNPPGWSSPPKSPRAATPSTVSRRSSMTSRKPSVTSRPSSAATSRPASAVSKSTGGSRPSSVVKFTLGPAADRTAQSPTPHEGDAKRVSGQDPSDVTADAYASGSRPDSAARKDVDTSWPDTSRCSGPVTAWAAALESQVVPNDRKDPGLSPAASPSTPHPSPVALHFLRHSRKFESPVPVFSKELWYKKGCKIIAAQQTNKRSQAGENVEEHDPEFVVQHLSRPTASSRNRQVNQVPSQHAIVFSTSVHNNNNPARKKTGIENRAIHPHRFKGTRSVTSEELQKIVSRLSACDPAQVPDSGRSRSRGKGYSGHAGYGAGLRWASSRYVSNAVSGSGASESASASEPSVRGVTYQRA